MRLRMFRRAAARKTHAILDGAASESTNLGRRALLTGGAVMAGAVGAGVAAAATAGPASADTGNPVLLGEQNSVTTDAATEIDATNNDALPTLILSNEGNPAGTSQASPQLRLTPAASNLTTYAASTVGGDMVATGDGNLYFTHGTSSGAIPAAVHTDATSNSFAPLAAPFRILDTRSTTGRKYILNASGNLDSTGRLLAGKTIYINLGSLVSIGDAVSANLTVIDPAANGWVLVWSGAGTQPDVSSIAFSSAEDIANFTMSAIADHTIGSTTYTDTIAVSASATTHVLLDVVGFYVASFAQVNTTASGLTPAAVSRASRSAIAKAAASHR
jgi:hypothetical protein